MLRRSLRQATKEVAAVLEQYEADAALDARDGAKQVERLRGL